MELRDVEYFAVIAEHSHLGRAARVLGISQPALSKSLGRLEAAVGAKLVRRTSKGVELTVEGATLQRRVVELRLSLQSVAREINEGLASILEREGFRSLDEAVGSRAEEFSEGVSHD